MSQSPEQLLALLAEIIRTAPRFDYRAPLLTEDERWLGRAQAVLRAAKDVPALVAFKVARTRIGLMSFSRSEIMIPLQDAYASLELLSPISAQGAFIPPGDAFNGYAALVRVVESAERDLLLVDPYIDASLLTELVPTMPEQVSIRCLTSTQSVDSIIAALGKWVATGKQDRRPVEVRTLGVQSRHLVDRIDDESVRL